MTFDHDIRRRRSLRLRDYDYAQSGAYFVTICTHCRECLFGDVVDGQMRLSDAGWVVDDEWVKTAEIRDEIELDAWVVMPNHFHAIIVLSDAGRGDRRQDAFEILGKFAHAVAPRSASAFLRQAGHRLR